MAPKSAETLTLPTGIVSRVDAIRLSREIEMIDNFLQQAKLRSGDTEEPAKQPRLSQLLEDLAHANSLNVLHQADRQQLQQFLAGLKKDAPTLHMSFAVMPPPAFTTKLMDWLRTEIHPLLLLDIGLQPSIAAGCVIRTTNKYFDCSLRQHLITNRPKLVEIIRSKIQ